MEKRTLLEIVNDVAASMDYETVNAIGETPESEQIVRIARAAYNELMTKDDWPHLKTIGKLEGLSDVTQPHVLKIPDTMAEIQSVRYDVTEDGAANKKMRAIKFYKHPEDFLDLVYTRDESKDEIEAYEFNGIEIPVFIDRHPTACTTFDDVHLVFDAFNEDEDSTLHADKTVVIGLSSKAWSNENTFIPDMPARMFPMYLAKVRILANEYLRQVTSREDVMEARSGFNRLRRKQRVEEEKRKPRYGRRRR